MPNSHAFQKVRRNPWRFLITVLKAFKANQGLLLAGALAYYILLSIIPLLTFLLLMLSHIANEDALLATLSRYLSLVIPGAWEVILAQVRSFLQHREVAGWFVLATMLFFSSLAFTVLENAMSIIFVHRVKRSTRPLFVSLLLPYLYILLLGLGFLLMTVIAGLLQSLSDNQIVVLGKGWSLDRFSVALLYLAGVFGLILVLASVYLVLPPSGRITPRHAFVGAVAVGLLWEVIRHALIWYFSTLSLVSVVYGSLATTVIGLLSLEIASILFLLGAQVIAEYERLGTGEKADAPLRT
jgi:membrane protein